MASANDKQEKPSHPGWRIVRVIIHTLIAALALAALRYFLGIK
jgi:hypothetical protein